MSSLNVRWSKLHETLLFRIIVKISFFFNCSNNKIKL